MCGIVGYAGRRQALGILLDGLTRLEYRGYDSAGVVIQNGHGLLSEKVPGKVAALRAQIGGRPFLGESGLGHTRWATHGGVTGANAHPHFSCDGKIAVVHNGIVENYAQLRADLESHRFTSATDTEVIPHLIEDELRKAGGSLLEALAGALKRIRGSLALGVMSSSHPGVLLAARINCPLVLGLGEGENFLASDISALLPHTRKIVMLEESELAEIDGKGIGIFDLGLRRKSRAHVDITWKADEAMKSGYPHFMLKEIHEQKDTIAAELNDREGELGGIILPEALDRVTLIGCGTAWNAGMVAKVAFEDLAGLPVEVGLGSELRNGTFPFGRNSLTIAVSQSGETADTLAAARDARNAGSRVLAVTNMKGSTLARECDQALYMRAGLEVGVAATKTYTSQLMNLLQLAMEVGRRRGALTKERHRTLLQEARRLPSQAARILDTSSAIAAWAAGQSKGRDFMYIGRHYNLATAYEGALKMKEISYLHAEGYGAGEMKHGPLAMVDYRLACVAIATEGQTAVQSIADHVIEIPACPELFSPVLAVIPLQLLAYHVATDLGRDVDQPRNLAKSVTVE